MIFVEDTAMYLKKKLLKFNFKVFQFLIFVHETLHCTKKWEM